MPRFATERHAAGHSYECRSTRGRVRRMATTTNAIPQPLIYSRPFTRGAFRPTQDAGPKGRVARGAKPSCSLTWRPALSVARGMRNAMGISVSRRESGRNQYAGDEAQPIGAVRMSESTRASPLVPPALARRPSWFAATCALLTRAHARRFPPLPRRRPEGPGGTRGEALVLSDAATGSFGGAWNAQRDGS